MVKELYGTFGFEKISEDDEGNTVWELPVEYYEKKCSVIRIHGNEAL